MIAGLITKVDSQLEICNEASFLLKCLMINKKMDIGTNRITKSHLFIHHKSILKGTDIITTDH